MTVPADPREALAQIINRVMTSGQHNAASDADRILAGLEAEGLTLAARQDEPSLRAAIEALPAITYGFDWPKSDPLNGYPLVYVRRDAVLALLADKEDR